MTALHAFTAMNCDAVGNHVDHLSGEDASLNYENKVVLHQGPTVKRLGILMDIAERGPLPPGFMGLTAYNKVRALDAWPAQGEATASANSY